MTADQFPWLTAIILLPLIASLFIPVLPDKNGKLLRWYSLGVGIADFVLMTYAFLTHYDASSSSFQLVEKYAWLPQIGLSWAVSIDGLSMPLVLLAGLVTTLAMFAAWQVDHKPRLFYFLMLTLYAAQIGVFVAQDVLLLFIMWELELVPVYLLIAIPLFMLMGAFATQGGLSKALFRAASAFVTPSPIIVLATTPMPRVTVSGVWPSSSQ